MTRRVLSVGQCAPDHSSISRFLQAHFEVAIVPVATAPEALDAVRKETYDLVLINRRLDIDYSDGIEILRDIKADPALAELPVMLITNYPEHQDNAVAVGAERGFGKNDLGRSDIVARLERFLA